MSSRPLISDSEKDKHKARDQLLKELSELRAQLAAKTEDLAGCERVVGMFDGITEPVLVLDDASQVVYANSAAARLFAKDGKAIEGRSLWDLYPKGSYTLFYNAYEKARKARSTGKFREHHRLLGKWFDVYLYPVPGGMTVLFNDITISRQMEELPRLALTLLHNLKDNVFLLRADGRMFHVNNETKNSLGYSSDELHKMRIFDLVPPACEHEWNDILDRIPQHGSMTFESRLRAKDGREFPVEVYANNIELYNNNYYTISARDITERKRMEEALRENEEKFRLVADFTYDWEIWLGPEGNIIYNSPSCERITGYCPEEFIENPRLFAKILSPEDRAAYEEHLRDHIKAHSEPDMIDFRIVTKDGAVRWINHQCQSVFGSNGQWLGRRIGNRDITERKQTEEALRETRDYLESLIDFANAPIIVWDPSFIITRFNHAFERLSGYNADEVLGKDLSVLFPPSGRDESLDKIRRTLAGEYWESVEIPILHKDGSIRIVLWNSANIHNEDKTLLATIAQGHDITERKRAEEALQVAKAQAELYVDLMGHDINNMNHIAMASLELALMELEQDGKLGASGIPLLEKSMESLNNSSQLIRNVHKLQRASTEGIKLQAVDVAEVLKDIIAKERSTPGKDVTIYYKNTATSCRVTANELLRDVFTNLISNAIKHSGQKKHLTIGVAVDSLDEGGKKFCRVVIEDNGPGIPDATKEKLFNRFARGATKARGSGLGLYLVRTLVEHYGGSIDVEDRVPGDYTRGAKFVVTIPSSDS